MASFPCHSCGTPLSVDDPVPRDAECPACRTDVRCCLNCRHHDLSYNNECRETMADPVPEKQRRNFCEYFAPERGRRAIGAAPRSEADARAKLEALFGGKGPKPQTGGGAPGATGAPSDRAGDARRKLDSLFGKPPARKEGDEG